MEQLNRIELRGNVGSVKIQTLSDDKRVARVSLCTNWVYKSRDGEPVIETTWHSISIWEGRVMQDLSAINKGDALHVIGRLRTQQYTGSDGIERVSYEVAASKVSILTQDEPLQYEN